MSDYCCLSVRAAQCYPSLVYFRNIGYVCLQLFFEEALRSDMDDFVGPVLLLWLRLLCYEMGCL